MLRFANPKKFLDLSGALLPWLWLGAIGLMGWGLYAALFATPADYQQGDSVRIMYIHVPSAWMASFIYGFMFIASVVGLVWKHPLADTAAKEAAPIGACFTAACLITGSLWGKPTWGTYWIWDARLTSVLVLFLVYLAYIALRASLDDETKAARAGAILALVGAVNLPIVKFSVDWWNTLHQGASVFRKQGPAMTNDFLWPLLLMGLAFMAAFGSLWLVGIRAQVWRRRAEAAAMRAARG